MFEKFNLIEGAKYCSEDLIELYLNQTWRPNMSVTGAGGLPDYLKAGNVIRAATTLRLSVRLPPNMDADKASKIM